MIWLFFIIIFSGYVLPVEYLYPVDADDVSVYLLHQKADFKTQLMRYNIQSQLLEPVLCPFYYPTQVQLLPDKSGLSFIDQGILKIFYFSKRSAMAIDAGFPVEAVSYQWINENTVAIVASNGAFFFIIVYSLLNDESRIIDEEDVHFYFPIVHQKDFFYIMREGEKQFLMRDSDKVKRLLPFFYPILKLYSFDNNLFALVYKENVDHLLIFWVVELDTCSKLFSFSLPDYLISDDTRLYEGLGPLYPRMDRGLFYYSDVRIKNDKAQWFVHRYAIREKRQDVLGSVGNGHCCFASLVVGQTLFYGDVLGPMNCSNNLNYSTFFSLLG